jgi:hypothetical protein
VYRNTRYFLAFVLVCLLLACSGDNEDAPSIETPAPPDTGTPVDEFLVGQPQNRAGIGDVDRAFARYEATRSQMIGLIQAQPWFNDGLTRDESLFVERTLAFSARQRGGRPIVTDEMIRRKLYLYERVPMSKSEVELLIIHEPGQDAQRQLSLMKAALPRLEALVGVTYPERVMTVVNGPFEINDFDDGQFIRIARCCTLSAFVLTHELAHSYWSMGPSWFNEGLADIYAILTLHLVGDNLPQGWSSLPANIDDFYNSRKRAVASGRFPEMALPRRLASDGLYEIADVFMLDIRRLIGVEAFSAAVKEIYVASDFGRYVLREKRIEDTFLSYAKPGDRDDIMSMFNRVVWGDNGERYRQLDEQEGP